MPLFQSPPAPAASNDPSRVGCIGLSAFERDTLEAYFGAMMHRPVSAPDTPSYQMVGGMEQAQLLLVDTEWPGAIRQVAVAGRLHDTLFIGGTVAPAGALAWLPRPVDALQIAQALGNLLERRARQARRGLVSGSPRAPRPPSGRARQQALANTSVQDFHLSTGYSNSVLADDDARLDAVLVVSSSPAERRMLRDELLHLGYRVRVAADGEAAVNAARRRAWRFIFLGMALADADPYHVCRSLKQGDVAGRPVVVMVGGHGSTTDHIRATFAGCDARLAQPLQEADLRQVLMRHDTLFERVFEPTAPLAL